MDVAVVIPAYNPGDHFEWALESVLAQSRPAAEIVVVDDGSAEPVAVADPRVRVIRQPNGGPGAARNRGVAHTSAPLIAFLDADDLWLPNKLAAQTATFHDRPNLGLCSTGFEILVGDATETRPGYGGHDGTYADLLRGCGIALSTVMVSREAFNQTGGFRSFATAEDWDLWLRIAQRRELHHLAEVMAHYRLHAGNISGDYRQVYRDAKLILGEHEHPAATAGRRRARHLAGAQAFDEARAARRQRDWPRLVRATGYAALHAPGLTFRGLVRR